jgi:hypothetical protein
MKNQSIVIRSLVTARSAVRASSRVLAAMSLVLVLGQLASAQAGAARSVAFADRFLRSEARGRETLNYLHFGADYHGHEYVKTLPIVDGDQRQIPGNFALVYRFYWEKDGVTDLAYLCDPDGYVYKVQVMETNAVWSQPFVLANATIKVLGNLLIEANKDKMTPLERKIVQKIVDSADAKALLEWQLKFEQRGWE